MSKKILSAEAIAAASDLEYQECEAWGGVVLIWDMSGEERHQLELMTTGRNGKNDPTNFSEKLLSLCIKDEDGKRLFTDPKDVLLLAKKNSRVVQRLAEVAAKRNGLMEDEVKERAKNS